MMGEIKGNCLSTSVIVLRAFISSRDRNGRSILGPVPSMIEKSTPKPGNGVRISMSSC